MAGSTVAPSAAVAARQSQPAGKSKEIENLRRPLRGLGFLAFAGTRRTSAKICIVVRCVSLEELPPRADAGQISPLGLPDLGLVEPNLFWRLSSETISLSLGCRGMESRTQLKIQDQQIYGQTKKKMGRRHQRIPQTN